MAIRTTTNDYIERAMSHAKYEHLPDGTVSGTIPTCPGVIEFGTTHEDAEARLQAALSGWIELGLRLGHPIPEIDGMTLQHG